MSVTSETLNKKWKNLILTFMNQSLKGDIDMRRVWCAPKPKQIWYVLTNNCNIYAEFTSFKLLQNYWKLLPMYEAMSCHWEVKEV